VRKVDSTQGIVKTDWYVDEMNGKVGVNRVQDVEHIVEFNKILRNEESLNPHKSRKGETFRKVASIPLVVVEDLMRKGIWDDKNAMKKWLNDSDNRGFRIWPGRV